MSAYTIDPEHAEHLADFDNGNDAGPWCRVADVRGDTGRWLEYRTLILLHDDGTLWGLRYAVGLTENQESRYPWRDTTDPLPLVRYWPHEQLVTEYRPIPPADVEVPNVLVDCVYDVLYSGLAGYNLILCPTTETGPDNGIEAGHIHDLAADVVKALQAVGYPKETT